MPKKAIFMDFYGTIAHEDGLCVKQICKTISNAAAEPVVIEEISAYWWSIYHSMFANSTGKRFMSLHRIAQLSLKRTAQYFDVVIDVDHLVESLYRQWQAPPLFDDAKAFFAKAPLPICFVENCDHGDLQSAIIHNELLPEKFVTSEDCKCYKPDSLIFQHALNCMSLTRDEIVFVGDSITCDVVGATRAGIDVVWMNRDKKPISKFMDPKMVCNSLDELLGMNIYE